MDESALKDELGDPDWVKPSETPDEPVVLWTYRCRDRLLWITLREGKVTVVQTNRPLPESR
jgi:hypothetical protein